MGLYSARIFPAIYDLLVDTPIFDEHRRRQLAEARGEILEIGSGTGLNLAHYPEGVDRLVTVDPNPGMNRKLSRRAASSGIEVIQKTLRGEDLPFEDASFDTVVTTITLCSVPDPARVVRQIHRVLRPGGRYLFLEHGLHPAPGVARWQRRLTPIQRIVGDGCRLDLDVAEVLAEVPWSDLEVETFHMEKTPRTHGWFYRGRAIR